MNDSIGGLAQAILSGGLAAGGCYLIGGAYMASWDLVPGLALLALLAWFVGTIIVAISMVMVGLPVSFILRNLNCKSPLVHGMAGAIAGFLIPALPAIVSDGTLSEVTLFFAVPGLIAGATAAFVWARWLERVAGDAVETEEPVAHDRGERWLR